jgi:hypothetical protein
MKRLALVLLFLSFNILAQEVTKLDLTAICQNNGTGIESTKEVVIADRGFCAEFLKLESETQVHETINILSRGITTPSTSNCDDQIIIPIVKDQWKFRIYASHSFTTYFNSDISFRSTRYNVDIKDYEWAERSSREFFTPETWKEEGNNPFQMIDEPSNTFTVSMEKNGNEFFLQAFHPKFLQAENQVKYMKGEIDGTPVDGVAPINKPFDGYDQVPGESELVANMNTHRQMTFEAGYGRRFTLLQGKLGSFNYVPSISAGVMVGNNNSIMVKANEWWEFEGHDDKYGVQGFGGSITNRFEFNTPKERFGVFYENKLSGYHQKHGFMDGTQKYNLGFMGNSVGMKFMIYNPKNHKKKVP